MILSLSLWLDFYGRVCPPPPLSKTLNIPRTSPVNYQIRNAFFFGRTDHESYTSNRAHENISNHVNDLVPVKTMCISSNIYFEELWCYSATFTKTHTLFFFSLIIKRTLTLSMPASKQTMQISINTLEVVVFLMVFN